MQVRVVTPQPSVVQLSYGQDIPLKVLQDLGDLFGSIIS